MAAIEHANEGETTCIFCCHLRSTRQSSPWRNQTTALASTSRFTGPSEDAARQALAREDVGTLAGHEAAWIEIASLRRLAGGRVQPDWPERFEGMLRYAGRKGWLSSDGLSVRGHCEWNR